MLCVIEYFYKSLKVIRNDTVEDAMCKSLLVFHCDYVCISYGSEMFNVKYWRDLEILGRVVQGDLIWRHSIDRI